MPLSRLGLRFAESGDNTDLAGTDPVFLLQSKLAAAESQTSSLKDQVYRLQAESEEATLRENVLKGKLRANARAVQKLRATLFEDWTALQAQVAHYTTTAQPLLSSPQQQHHPHPHHSSVTMVGPYGNGTSEYGAYITLFDMLGDEEAAFASEGLLSHPVRVAQRMLFEKELRSMQQSVQAQKDRVRALATEKCAVVEARMRTMQDEFRTACEVKRTCEDKIRLALEEAEARVERELARGAKETRELIDLIRSSSEASVDELANKLSDLALTTESLRAENEVLSTKLERFQHTKKAAVAKQLMEVEKNNEVLYQQVVERDATVKDLKKAVKQAEAVTEESRSRLRDAEAELHRSRALMGELQDQYNELEQSSRASVAELQAKLDTALMDLEVAARQLDKQKALLAKYNPEEVEKLQEQLRRYEGLSQETELELTAAKGTIQQREEQLSALQADHAERGSLIEKLQRDLADAQVHRELLDSRIEAETEKLRMLTNRARPAVKVLEEARELLSLALRQTSSGELTAEGEDLSGETSQTLPTESILKTLSVADQTILDAQRVLLATATITSGLELPTVSASRPIATIAAFEHGELTEDETLFLNELRKVRVPDPTLRAAAPSSRRVSLVPNAATTGRRASSRRGSAAVISTSPSTSSLASPPASSAVPPPAPPVAADFESESPSSQPSVAVTPSTMKRLSVLGSGGVVGPDALRPVFPTSSPLGSPRDRVVDEFPIFAASTAAVVNMYQSILDEREAVSPLRSPQQQQQQQNISGTNIAAAGRSKKPISRSPPPLALSFGGAAATAAVATLRRRPPNNNNNGGGTTATSSPKPTPADAAGRRGGVEEYEEGEDDMLSNSALPPPNGLPTFHLPQPSFPPPRLLVDMISACSQTDPVVVTAVAGSSSSSPPPPPPTAAELAKTIPRSLRHEVVLELLESLAPGDRLQLASVLEQKGYIKPRSVTTVVNVVRSSHPHSSDALATAAVLAPLDQSMGSLLDRCPSALLSVAQDFPMLLERWSMSTAAERNGWAATLARHPTRHPFAAHCTDPVHGKSPLSELELRSEDEDHRQYFQSWLQFSDTALRRAVRGIAQLWNNLSLLGSAASMDDESPFASALVVMDGGAVLSRPPTPTTTDPHDAAPFTLPHHIPINQGRSSTSHITRHHHQQNGSAAAAASSFGGSKMLLASGTTRPASAAAVMTVASSHNSHHAVDRSQLRSSFGAQVKEVHRSATSASSHSTKQHHQGSLVRSGALLPRQFSSDHDAMVRRTLTDTSFFEAHEERDDAEEEEHLLSAQKGTGEPLDGEHAGGQEETTSSHNRNKKARHGNGVGRLAPTVTVKTAGVHVLLSTPPPKTTLRGGGERNLRDDDGGDVPVEGGGGDMEHDEEEGGRKRLVEPPEKLHWSSTGEQHQQQQQQQLQPASISHDADSVAFEMHQKRRLVHQLTKQASATILMGAAPLHHRPGSAPPTTAATATMAGRHSNGGYGSSSLSAQGTSASTSNNNVHPQWTPPSSMHGSEGGGGGGALSGSAAVVVYNAGRQDAMASVAEELTIPAAPMRPGKVLRLKHQVHHQQQHAGGSNHNTVSGGGGEEASVGGCPVRTTTSASRRPPPPQQRYLLPPSATASQGQLHNQPQRGEIGRPSSAASLSSSVVAPTTLYSWQGGEAVGHGQQKGRRGSGTTNHAGIQKHKEGRGQASFSSSRPGSSGGPHSQQQQRHAGGGVLGPLEANAAAAAIVAQHIVATLGTPIASSRAIGGTTTASSSFSFLSDGGRRDPPVLLSSSSDGLGFTLV